MILALFLRPLTLGLFNYLPAGPTPIIFAVLAQYHAMVPYIYQYKPKMKLKIKVGDEEVEEEGLLFMEATYIS